jgi:hypothetical protein
VRIRPFCGAKLEQARGLAISPIGWATAASDLTRRANLAARLGREHMPELHAAPAASA